MWATSPARARELFTELVLGSIMVSPLPDADEIAATAWRTLQLPEIAAHARPARPGMADLHFECRSRQSPTALAGRIDAIAYDNERPEIVVDWKSDIDPSERDMRERTGQMEEYLRATGAPRGALVYMTRAGVVNGLCPASAYVHLELGDGATQCYAS